MKDNKRKKESGYDSRSTAVFIGGMIGAFLGFMPGDIVLKAILLLFSVGFTMGGEIITFRDREEIAKIKKLLKEALE